MNYWNRLVSDNPLLHLILGASLRSLSPGKLRFAASTVWLILAVIVGLSVLAGYYSEVLAWQFFLMPLLVLLVLIPLAVLHGSIAGEREKRSIEVLLATPLSSSQILIAKSSKVLLPLTVCVATFVPVALAIEIGHVFEKPMWASDSVREPWVSFVLAMTVLVVSSLFSAALTIFVSVRTRTAAAALIGSLFALLAWLVGLPILGASLSNFGAQRANFDPIMLSNPFFVVWRLVWDQSVTTPRAVQESLALSLVLVVLAFFLVAGSRRRIREFRGKSQDA